MAFLREERPAIGRMALVVLTIAVVVVGGAIGALYPRPGQASSSTSTTSTTTESSVSSSSSTIALSSSSSSVSSSASSTTQTLAEPPLFDFNVNSTPSVILLDQGASRSYASVAIVPLPSSLILNNGFNVGIGDELVVLNATVPNGIFLNFYGSNLTNRMYIEASPAYPQSILLNLTSSHGAPPGNYNVALEARSGSYSYNYTFTVKVVQYLIPSYGGGFLTKNLSVKTGATVYWMNLNTDQNRFCSVAISPGGVTSPELNPAPYFDFFSYTFNTPGTYSYNCQNAPSNEGGTITVTS
jgi:plastocyanin